MNYRDNFEFCDERTVIVFRRLLEAWRNRIGGFARVIPPEIELLPGWAKDNESACSQLLLFWAFLNQGRSKTREVMAKAVPIVEKRRYLIDANAFVRDYGALGANDWLSVALGPLLPYGDVAKKRYAARWHHNLVKLAKEYGGDPRQIFLRCEPTLEAIQQALMQFDGFGPKVANLALLFFQGVHWSDYRDKWELIRQIPLALGDVWVLRLVYMLGILTKILGTDHHKQAGPMIAQYIIDICTANDIPTFELSQALWSLGADICGNRPGYWQDPRAWVYCLSDCPCEQLCQCFVPAAGYRETGRIDWHINWPRPNMLVRPAISGRT